MKKSWLLLLTILWPLLQLGVFFIRFNRLDLSIILESLYYLPLGFLSAFVLYRLILKSNKAQSYWVIGGYILTFPFALIASLMGGLILPPLIGVTIYGLVPICLGMGAGFGLGKLFANPGSLPKPE